MIFNTKVQCKRGLRPFNAGEVRENRQVCVPQGSLLKWPLLNRPDKKAPASIHYYIELCFTIRSWAIAKTSIRVLRPAITKE